MAVRPVRRRWLHHLEVLSRRDLQRAREGPGLVVSDDDRLTVGATDCVLGDRPGDCGRVELSVVLLHPCDQRTSQCWSICEYRAAHRCQRLHRSVESRGLVGWTVRQVATQRAAVQDGHHSARRCRELHLVCVDVGRNVTRWRRPKTEHLSSVDHWLSWISVSCVGRGNATQVPVA